MDEKDSENKKFIRDVLTIAGVVIVTVAGTAISLLGGDSKLKLPNSKEWKIVIRRWRNQISNAFLIVHHNLYQLLFSVKFNHDKSISYFNKISGKWKSKYNEYWTNITKITNKSGYRLFVVKSGTDCKSSLQFLAQHKIYKFINRTFAKENLLWYNLSI